jgi:CheY-like chemotaxis protein
VIKDGRPVGSSEGRTLSGYDPTSLPADFQKELINLCVGFLREAEVQPVVPLLPRRVQIPRLSAPGVLVPFSATRCSILILDVMGRIIARYVYDWEAEALSGGIGAKPVLVIVEDEPEILDLVEESFSQDFSLHTFTAPPPLPLLEALSPDAILLDLQLPEIMGEDFLEKVRIRQRWHVPVIIVSGQPHRQATLDARGLFYNRFLRKPIEMSEIETAIRRCLALQ